MSTQSTSAPWAANASALDRPMPLPAPVISTSLPASGRRDRPTLALASSRLAGRPSMWSTNSVTIRLTAAGWVRIAQCSATSSRRHSRSHHGSAASSSAGAQY
jgi:hypothetical protein